ncbi:hypothetical protein PanWU01x14_351550 [Parasponia andersonii]|uniref:Uncharacterized protein n=1 Tax=Parasponia andersonii TaxID=3476 RepID=A0A2P5AAN0_PARAD|nr:hypothetical protein PanWU01x14_351550 [Parasponia andersonii]
MDAWYLHQRHPLMVAFSSAITAIFVNGNCELYRMLYPPDLLMATAVSLVTSDHEVQHKELRHSLAHHLLMSS